MAVTYVDEEVSYNIHTCSYYDQINHLIAPTITELKRATKSYVRFNIFFMLLLAVETLLLVTCFSIFMISSLLAMMLSAIFFTVFTYFMLRVYFLGKKSEALKSIKDQFVDKCKEFLSYQEGIPECHIALANACSKMAGALQGMELRYYRAWPFAHFLGDFFEKFSCWWHWYDVFKMKELLLTTSVNEHIMLVKCEPTSLELHTALANAYVMLSGLYVDPRKLHIDDDLPWSPFSAYEDFLKTKFRQTAEKAIEEFKILNEFAPNDPWIHTQLAYSYHDLQMPMDEIREYQVVIRLRPDDKEALYKLGVLYFQQGMNADGLRVYEELKQSHYKKAEALIQHYGAYSK